MYYVYALKSIKDGNMYYGMTSDLNRRIEDHNKGKVKSTRSRRPLKVIYYEKVKGLKNARRKERYFKSGFGRKYIKNKIKELDQKND